MSDEGQTGRSLYEGQGTGDVHETDVGRGRGTKVGERGTRHESRVGELRSHLETLFLRYLEDTGDLYEFLSGWKGWRNHNMSEWCLRRTTGPFCSTTESPVPSPGDTRSTRKDTQTLGYRRLRYHRNDTLHKRDVFSTTYGTTVWVQTREYGSYHF